MYYLFPFLNHGFTFSGSVFPSMFDSSLHLEPFAASYNFTPLIPRNETSCDLPILGDHQLCVMAPFLVISGLWLIRLVIIFPIAPFGGKWSRVQWRSITLCRVCRLPFNFLSFIKAGFAVR
jgi:hypothetical protein